MKCDSCDGTGRNIVTGECEACRGHGFPVERVHVVTRTIGGNDQSVSVESAWVPSGASVDQATIEVARDALLEGNLVAAHKLLRPLGTSVIALIAKAVDEGRHQVLVVRP